MRTSMLLVTLLVPFAALAQQSAPEQPASTASAQAAPEVVPPNLIGYYPGRWTIVTSYGTNSNTTDFRVLTPFQKEQSGPFWLATGTYSTYPSDHGRPCSRHVDVPMELRWNPDTNEYFLVGKPTEPNCPQRRFRLVREPSGRFTWTSKDGFQSVYFEPEKK